MNPEAKETCEWCGEEATYDITIDGERIHLCQDCRKDNAFKLDFTTD